MNYISQAHVLDITSHIYVRIAQYSHLIGINTALRQRHDLVDL